MRRPVAQFRAVQSARSLLRVAAKLIVLAALAASVPGGAAAQSAFGSISVGDRIRISTAAPDSMMGTAQFLSATDDTLVVRTKQNGREITRAISRGRITRLDVSMGRTRSHKSQFAGIGFLVGAGIGKYIHRDDPVGPAFLDEAAVDGLMDALLLGGLGAGIGAFIGRPHERWRRVPLGAPRVSLSLPRTGRGVGLSASMAF
jgi:hypothetical protein